MTTLQQACQGQPFHYYGNMELKHAVAALSALAQESRLAAFRLLVVVGPEGMPAGEIGEELGIPPATLSFHLKELVHAGLIESRRESRSIRYSLCTSAVKGLFEFLMEDCCQGRADLCGVQTEQLCCGPPPAKRTAKRKGAR